MSADFPQQDQPVARVLQAVSLRDQLGPSHLCGWLSCFSDDDAE